MAHPNYRVGDRVEDCDSHWQGSVIFIYGDDLRDEIVAVRCMDAIGDEP
jgi:hypothetical protein